MIGVIGALVKAAKLAAWPVGSVYMSLQGTSPAVLFGGTWEAITDTFLLAYGEKSNPGDRGGEWVHTLTVAEVPYHAHNLPDNHYMGSWGLGAAADFESIISTRTWGMAEAYTKEQWGVDGADTTNQMAFDQTTLATEYVGGNQYHNNMPPYLAVYMWQRTA